MADRKFEEGPGNAYKQGLYEESATALDTVGRVRWDVFGNQWLYCKNGAAALLAGNAITASVATSTTEDTVTVAHAIGTSVVTVTAAGATADQFAGGTLTVDEGTGLGETYRIVSNTAAASNLIQVTLNTGLITAWSTSDTDVTLLPNRANGVIINPVNGLSVPIGVAQRPVTAAYYFWVLKDGIGGLALDGATAAGAEIDEQVIVQSVNHAGLGTVCDTASLTPLGRHIIGELWDASADVGDNKVAIVRIKL